ncbi:MAG: class I SAM-dependent methyltransferase [Acidimicrobiia bacterium]
MPHERDPYTERLKRVSGARWKQVLNVQAPYRWNLRRLNPGYVLDIGCGIGRNLIHLDRNGVGVDTSAASVAAARAQGCVAYTSTDFPAAPEAEPGVFDSLLFAHVLEHMDRDQAASLVGEYLAYLKPGGCVIVIVPQEAGFATDTTHVNFLDTDDLHRMMSEVSLTVARSYSFPFPRPTGRVFAYNETVVVAHSDPD